MSPLFCHVIDKAMTDKTMYIIAGAIDAIVCHDRVNMRKLAEEAGYRPAYFEKIFKARTGLTTAQLMRFKKMRHAHDFLLQGYSTLDAAYEAGLSGQGRLHESFVTMTAATPGEVKRRGAGVEINYDVFPTCFGLLVLGATDKGLSWAGFENTPQALETGIEKMRKHLPKARYVRQTTPQLQNYAHKLESLFTGYDIKKPLPLHVFGTNFQIQIWQALLRIPQGAHMSYKTIGAAIGREKSARAIGGAVGANPLGWIIPCHRVLQASGIVENYAYGSARKCVLLGFEAK